MNDINSLKNTSEFKEVYEHGISAVNSLLAVYALSGEGDLRLGISVSKKVGNSVVRHRVVRLIRESYRLNKDTLKPGYDIVIIARNTSKGEKFATIESAYLQLLKLHGLFI